VNSEPPDRARGRRNLDRQPRAGARSGRRQMLSAPLFVGLLFASARAEPSPPSPPSPLEGEVILFDIAITLRATDPQTTMNRDVRSRMESAFSRVALVPHFFVRASSAVDADGNVDINVAIRSVSDNSTIAQERLAVLLLVIGSEGGGGQRASEFLLKQVPIDMPISEVTRIELSARRFEPPEPESKDGLSPMGVVFVILAVLVSLAMMYMFANETGITFDYMLVCLGIKRQRMTVMIPSIPQPRRDTADELARRELERESDRL
jgi:hypothetical protein